MAKGTQILLPKGSKELQADVFQNDTEPGLNPGNIKCL